MTRIDCRSGLKTHSDDQVREGENGKEVIQKGLETYFLQAIGDFWEILLDILRISRKVVWIKCWDNAYCKNGISWIIWLS